MVLHKKGESLPEYPSLEQHIINQALNNETLIVTKAWAKESKLVTDEERRFQLVSQSGLLKILDLAKTAPAESKLDEVSLLLAIKGNDANTLFFKEPDDSKKWF